VATNLMRSDFSAVSPVTMHFRNDISSAAMAALKGCEGGDACMGAAYDIT